MSCERGPDVGAYLLRALGDDEAVAFAAHITTCAECRTAVADLGVVVDALALAAPQVAPAPELKGRIMAIVESEAALLSAAGPDADRPPIAPRRRWRPTLSVRPAFAAAVACVLVAAGAGGGLLLSGDDGPATRVVGARVELAGAKASLAVTGSRAALRVQGMPSPPRGKVYQVWFKRGNEPPVATHTLFNVRRDGNATVEIDEPVDGVDLVLVTAERSGGSMVPTSKPVIVAAPA